MKSFVNRLRKGLIGTISRSVAKGKPGTGWHTYIKVWEGLHAEVRNAQINSGSMDEELVS